MMQLFWTSQAIKDREEIYDYIESNNPLAALAFDNLISKKAAVLQSYPRIGRTGRVAGTSELVIHSNYMIVYDIVSTQIRILNIVHTARQWPS